MSFPSIQVRRNSLERGKEQDKLQRRVNSSWHVGNLVRLA